MDSGDRVLYVSTGTGQAAGTHHSLHAGHDVVVREAIAVLEGDAQHVHEDVEELVQTLLQLLQVALVEHQAGHLVGPLNSAKSHMIEEKHQAGHLVGPLNSTKIHIHT